MLWMLAKVYQNYVRSLNNMYKSSFGHQFGMCALYELRHRLLVYHGACYIRGRDNCP